jgi:hypothetical protein
MSDIAANERQVQLERQAHEAVSLTDVACKHNRRLIGRGHLLICQDCYDAVRGYSGEAVEIAAGGEG